MSHALLSFYNSAKSCSVINIYTYMFVIVSFAAPYTASIHAESIKPATSNSAAGTVPEKLDNKPEKSINKKHSKNINVKILKEVKHLDGGIKEIENITKNIQQDVNTANNTIDHVNKKIGNCKGDTVCGIVSQSKKEIKHIAHDVKDIQNQIGDCKNNTVCSELSMINSKIDNLDQGTDCCSTVDAINSTVDVVSSKIDALNLGSNCCSTVDAINSTVDAISSKIDDLNLGSNCCSTVDAINSTVDVISSKIDALNPTTDCCSTVDVINSTVDVISSKIDALNTDFSNVATQATVSIIESIVENIDAKISSCDNSTICSNLSIVDSKIDALDTDFSNVATQAAVSIVDSKIDVINNILNECDTCTELSIIESIVENISVKVDALNPINCDICSNVSIVDSKIDALDTDFSNVATQAAVSIVDSKIDVIGNQINNIDAELIAIQDQLGDCNVCDSLSSIDSQVNDIDTVLTNIQGQLGDCNICDSISIVDSKIDALDADFSNVATRAAVSIVDSKIDAIDADFSNVATQAAVSIIDSKIDAIGNQINNIDAELIAIQGQLGDCNVCDSLSSIDSQVNDIDTVLTNIQGQLGDCNICDSISIVDSKIDALDTDFSNVATQATVSIIESIVENIDSKISSCDNNTICSNLSIVDSKIDVIGNQINNIDAELIAIQDQLGDCNVCDSLSSIDSQVNDIDTVLTNIQNQLGDCNICDSISIVDSKIDTIKESIGDCNICDSISIVDSKIDTIINSDLCGPTVITATTTITNPGNYCVANSFDGSITVSSSDVYLDLNERTVTNNSGNAVEVASGFEQVTITNGFVVGSNAGIQVDSGCSNITISDVSALNCGNQGIWLDQVSTGKIVGCELLSTITGLQIDSSTQILVTDCIASSNTQAGIALSNSTDCSITGCKAVGNGAGTANSNTYGIVSDSGSCNIIEKCTVVDTEIVGININCTSCFVPYMDPLIVQNCTIGMVSARGIALLNSEQDSKVIDCEVGCTQASANFILCDYERILSPNLITQAFGIALDEMLTTSLPELTLNQVASSSASTSTINSIAWFVSNGKNYLATGGLESEGVEIFVFDTNPEIGLQQIATSSLAGSSVGAVAWLICDGNNYLAATDYAGGDIYIFKFDSVSDLLTTVTQINISAEHIFSAAWLIADDNNYLAIGAENNENNLVILNFDPELNSLTIVTENPGFFDPTTSAVRSVAWLTSDDNNYLAIGGIPSGETNTVKVFEFIPTTSSLNLIVTSSSIVGIGGAAFSVAWFVCDGTNYLATGGIDPFSGDDIVQVHSFDVLSTSTLTQVASSSESGVATNSVAWLVCNNVSYLATGNQVGPDYVRIFEFDPTSTNLELVATNSAPGAYVNSVAWLVSDGQAYLATGGAGTDELNIFDFGCTPEGILPQNNIIKNNLVYDTNGIGINGDSTVNLIASNIAYNNGQNYGDGVLTSQINANGIGGIALDSLLNRSLPPLESTGDCKSTVINATTIITNPGNYCLANSFDGSITVSSSDVYLDLNERTVTNNSGNAVEVMSGFEQITITNGFVTGSNAGIKVNNNCSAITISDVSALNCGNQGIWLDQVSTGKIVGCELLSTITGLQITGLQIDNSTQILVTDCIASSNVQAGIALYNSTDCSITGCKAIGNGAGTAGIDTYGIVSDSGSCNIIEKCTVIDTEIVFICPPTCFVPYMDPLVIQDCTTTVKTARGIALLNTEQNSKIIDCEVGCTQVSSDTCQYERILLPNSTDAFGIALNLLTAPSSTLPTLNLSASANVPSYSFAISSIAWLINNGNNYLAVSERITAMGHSNIQIFTFDPTSTTSLESQLIFNFSSMPTAIAWLVCNNNNYLAVLSTIIDAGPSKGLIDIYEFDSTSTSLTLITHDLGNPLPIATTSAAWLIADNNNYLAVGGTQGSSNNFYGLTVVEFDPSLGSLTTAAQTSVFAGNDPGTVNSVAWLVSNGHNYVAVGGSPIVDTDTVKIFEFITTTSTLNLIATSSLIAGDDSGSVQSVAWLACNDTNYLAVGGIDSDGNEVVQILDFNILSTPTLTEAALFTGTADTAILSVAWFVCDTTTYLAAGNENSSDNVKIFEFDPTSTTSLTQVIDNTVSDGAVSIAWLVNEKQAYLATGGNNGSPNPINIFDFGCYDEPVLPQNNIIKNNLVYDTDGVGINGDSTVNFIASNVAYNNSQNYGDSVLTSQINANGIGGIALDSLLNRSLPPLESSVIDIAAILINIQDQLGDCTLCDSLSIIDSKIDALNTDPSSCATQESVSIIDSKIDLLLADSSSSCATQESVSIIDSKIDLLLADSSSSCATQESVSIVDSKIDTIINADLCGPTVITATTTITNPGNYCVANSFDGSITVSSSGVYLDLNERTVTNNSGNAVEVVNGFEQVTITNGFVVGSNAGIKVNNNCNAITISDVSALNCGNQGIWFTQVSTSKIVGCELLSTITGLQIDSSTQILVTDCITSSNTQAGIALYNSSDCSVTECKAVANGAGTAGINTYGIISDSGSCNIFEKCTVLDTEIVGTFTCPTCFVPYMDPLIIQDCTLSTTAASAGGIVLFNTEQNSKIIDCEVGCTQAASVSSCGYNRILSPAPTQAFGIALDGITTEVSTPPTFNPVVSTFDLFSGINVNSVAWLNCNGTNYLATGLAPDQLQIFIFDPNSTQSLVQVASYTLPDVALSIAWLICDGNNYLAAADGSGNLNILQFDPTSNALTSIANQAPGLSEILSAAWLIADNNNYLAIGGNSGSGDVIILNFDTTLNLLTTVTKITPAFAIRSVAWLVSDNNNYLAVGSIFEPASSTIEIFEFTPTTSSLTSITTSNSMYHVESAAWLVCDGANYLAIGGQNSLGHETTQILDFNISMSTLTEVATFSSSNGIFTFSVAWLVCDNKNYLATGSFDSTTNIRIFEFDPTSTTSLSSVATINTTPSDEVIGLAWLVSENQVYLAPASPDIFQLNIFNFICDSQTTLLPQNNIVKNNLVYNTNGTGIDADSTANLIAGNVAYNNILNYSNSVVMSHINNNGIGGIALDSLLNRSLPPVIDTNADTTDECFSVPQNGIINVPGNYCLNSQFNGTITINVSNVTIDLNGFTITPIVTSSDGIDISPNISNFHIKNGSIIDGLNGILINNGCSAFTISDISLLNNNNYAISISDGCNNFALSDIKILNGGINALVAGTGITNFTIDNTIVTGVKSTGFSLANTSYFTISNCTAQNCNTDGFDIAVASYGTIDNCIARNNEQDGFSLEASLYITGNNCVAQGNMISGFRATGATNVTLKNCIAQNNTADGFDLGTTTLVDVMSCSAQSNAIYGFYLSAATLTDVISCRALNNSVGFYQDVPDIGNSFANNFAFHNTTNYSSILPFDTAVTQATAGFWSNLAIPS